MSFIPEYAEWIRARVQDVPVRTASFCGDLAGLDVLDVGCGDMMMDIGLLSLQPARITGLDVRRPEFSVIEHAAQEVAGAGYSVPPDYTGRLSYRIYTGGLFPFPENSFDIVFSWGVFEHISNPEITLSEARRVVKPSGRIFVVVYPWYHSFHGSHLADYISEPYFHLHRPKQWVWNQLNEFLARNPDLAEKPLQFWRKEGYTLRTFLREHMWNEYRTLNCYSARRFFKEAMHVGLIAEKVETQIEEHPAAASVRDATYADLITAGSTVLFRPGKSTTPSRTPWSAAVRNVFHRGL